MTATSHTCSTLIYTAESSACAFSFFSKEKKRKAPIYISEELGLSPTLQYQFFDPFNLATEETFAYYREAELKHCRISMLAVLGNSPLPNMLRSYIPNSHSLMLSPSHNIAFDQVPLGLKALHVVPILGWIQIIVLIGILETQIFIQRDSKDMPGDYGVGYFGLRDKRRHERYEKETHTHTHLVHVCVSYTVYLFYNYLLKRSLRCELENGRLAMLAFVGQIVCEWITGLTVDKQMEYLYKWILVN